MDDACLAATNESDIKEFVTHLKQTFEVKTEPLRFFLGAHVIISPDRRTISLTQTRYIEELLEKFQLENSKAIATPTDGGINTAYQAELNYDLPYRNLVGSINYISSYTHGDISYALSKLSRYLDKPTKPLYAAGLRVLKYLKTTKTFGPKYTADHAPTFVCYCEL